MDCAASMRAQSALACGLPSKRQTPAMALKRSHSSEVTQAKSLKMSEPEEEDARYLAGSFQEKCRVSGGPSN
jgi:hypothetical protein